MQAGLWWKNVDGVILGCVSLEESENLLQQLHGGLCDEHFSARTTAHKILRAGYYWPSLLTDTH